MKLLIDLEDPCAVDKLWSAYQRHHAGQRVEPELYDGVCQLLATAEDGGRLPRLTCDALRSELRRSRPSAVLSGFWQDLIENRWALGHYLSEGVLADAA